MNRKFLREKGEETVTILKERGYETGDGKRVDLSASITKSVSASRLLSPSDLETLASKSNNAAMAETTEVSVTGETTLMAARGCVEEGLRTGALNFASAKRPGGGFRSGAGAQEESLARASTLLPSLEANPGYYAANARTNDGIYTDHLIWSPEVSVFRDDDMSLLERPWTFGVITMPATNAGVASKRWRGEGEFRDANKEIMRGRMRSVLAVAREEKLEALVLGAWGCGVFGNDADTIARLWAETLEEPAFKNMFGRVVFAVYAGKPKEDKTLQAFQTVFSSTPTSSSS